MTDQTISAARTLLARCDELTRFSEQDGNLTRRYGTPALAQTMDAVAGWMTEAGLSIRRDAIGNLIGRREGTTPDAGTLVLGSHLDSVIDAGRYDGPLGVLSALAVAEQIGPLPFALEVVAFADEEGVRFSTYMGSSVYTGVFNPGLLDQMDQDGVTLRDAVSAFGGDPEALANGLTPPEHLLGYLEVHIEQGPSLEALDLPVGVVTAIAGRSGITVTYDGTAGHAGTVPMVNRRDALTGAAELALAAERIARGNARLLATVGEFVVRPGAANVIAGSATITLDVRSADDDARDLGLRALNAAANDIANRRKLNFRWVQSSDMPATPCDPVLQSWLAASITEAGYPVHSLPSGAGHDAVIMSRVCPAAMLFVRCKGGISHNPAESVNEADVAVAIEVFQRTVERAGREWSA